MGLFDRAEKGLERAVSSAFAKAFKAEVQPVEIASAIRSTMDDRAAVIGPGRIIVPNRFAVQLAPPDYERLKDYGETLLEELVVAAEEHRDSQRYATPGPVRVIIQKNEDLEPGVVDVVPSSSKPQSRRARSPMHDPGPDPLRSRSTGPRFAPGPGVEAPEPPAQDTRLAPSRAGGPATAAYPSQHTAPSRSRQEMRPFLDMDGQRYPLLGAITVLGRDESADIILDDSSISRRHSEIRVTHDGPHRVATLRDLGSTNGTYLNGERVGTARLTTGDRITLGRISVIFTFGDAR